MTLPSLRKLRTTPPSISTGTPEGPGGRITRGVLVLLTLFSITLVHHLTAEEHPLDQLRGRSAEKRWKSLRERFSDRREDRRERRRHDTPDATDHATDPALANRPENGRSPVTETVAEQLLKTISPSRSREQADRDEVLEAHQPSLNVPRHVLEPQLAEPSKAEPNKPEQPSLVAIPELPAPTDSAVGNNRPTSTAQGTESDSQPRTVATKPEAATPSAPRMAQASPARESAPESFEEPLYRERFQVELSPSGSASGETAGRARVETADPHPGLLPVSERRTSQAKPLPVPAESSRTDDQFPIVPLAPFSPPEPRLVQRDPLALPNTEPAPGLLPEKLPEDSSLSDYLYTTDGNIKPLDEILPFPNYEPIKDVRERDPYSNLCPPPAGVVTDEFHCPDIAELPRDEIYEPRNFAHVDKNWVPTNIKYYPLYFQDVNLERYGHMEHPVVQPAKSVALFSGQFLLLPYQMAMHQVRRPTYPLGYLQPGDVAAPKLYYRTPINFQAAAVAAGVYTGWVFLIP